MTSPGKTEAGGRPGRRGALGRKLLLAAAAPFVALGALEGTLRLGGYGVPTGLFIPDQAPDVYRTNPHFTAPFIPASFGIHPLPLRLHRHKAPNALRVFVVGESAAEGIPEPDYGFAAQLRANLRAQFPGREVELCNLGITAIDSHVVRQVVSEAAGFEPDLFVIYMGNNEVVGPYGPGSAYLSETPPLAVIRASVWIRGTRTGQLLAALLARLAPAGSRTPEWKGMETFAGNTVRADDPRLTAVYANFAANLGDILESARRSGAKIVLSTVAANLAQCAPFISLHRTDLSGDAAKAWAAAYDEGVIASDLMDAGSAGLLYERAAQIDPHYADLAFRQAQLDQLRGAEASARQHYLEALHWDALRFRPDPRINALIRDGARAAGEAVVLVDAAREFGSDPDSQAPLTGSALFLDHVHFSWSGNVRMAQLLDAACLRQLLGPGAARAAPLDSGACVAALGFTPDIELRMLKTMVELTLRPPFTGQMTFSMDQARQRRRVEATEADLSAQGPAAAQTAVAAAVRQDPGNPALLSHLADLEADLGHPSAAREAAEKAAALEPDSVDRSIALARILGRNPETVGQAEDLLREALEKDPVYYTAGTPLIGLWAARGEWDEGKRVLSTLVGRHPRNPYLRLEYATLLARAGDGAGAEREARAVWEADPSGRPATAALELRVRLDAQAGRQAAADALSLEAASAQPDDYFNNERLVKIYGARGDANQAATALLAVAASGPFDSQQHVALARRLADLGRTREMVDELARAQDVARAEGDGQEEGVITGIVEAFRQRFHPPEP